MAACLALPSVVSLTFLMAGIFLHCEYPAVLPVMAEALSLDSSVLYEQHAT